MNKKDEEIWKYINGYEGLYRVSSFGRIQSKRYKIKKPIKRKDGFLSIDLYKDGNRKRFLIHRLVAEAFIKNPIKYPHVIHIDGNGQNNVPTNLKWVKKYDLKKDYIKENYVSKDKIKAKIEELDKNEHERINKIKNHNEMFPDLIYISNKKILEQLLKEGEENV